MLGKPTPSSPTHEPFFKSTNHVLNFFSNSISVTSTFSTSLRVRTRNLKMVKLQI
ncbi:unnamed protein product [Hymenolepis diminuta]|uniref:Uncharacterized protein n=1 Tax=Hymenolepis diminuta TaxID=6216 RepID=A0A564Y1T4_HYMDI|nr:unnamed protein product [Hymenolepis diminuta]VUZ41096.1 unnamed protein product [Hymenolepis diminuta]VUZ52781.1 unnamed protein product [Hymenolepis diminuta]